jgi:TetR/AcrR family transcriptional regulator, regulator of cefoperazone and chloramphenicol sensitivity
MASKAKPLNPAIQPVSSDRSAERTRERLIEVGTELFATRGLEGTTIRDLAEAADVNVAAVHYHFGGKEQLYAAVVDRVFAAMKDLREFLEGELDSAKAVGGQTAAAASLGRCIRAFLAMLYRDNHASWGGAFLQRESIEPTRAMQDVLDRFILPAWRTARSLLELIRPDLADTDAIRFIASSIVGQCLYYQQSLPIVFATHDIQEVTPAFLETVASHISQFSLCALLNGPREEIP